MKYSFIIPFINRPSFLFTLKSFKRFYKDRDDFEIVIIEDKKNVDSRHDNLIENINKFPEFKFNHIQANFDTTNPVQAYNLGIDNSIGEFIVITNPECMHHTNILEGFDKYFNESKDYYCICACLAVNLKVIKDDSNIELKEFMWYQHSVFNNRMFHFTSAMSRNNYRKIGGFDNHYGRGHSYDDNDFYEKVLWYKLPIKTCDELIVYHIEHDRYYNMTDETRITIEKINKDYFNKKWDTIKSTNISPINFEKNFKEE